MNESQTAPGSELTELHSVIIDTINKEFTYVSDVLDYCGPRLSEQSRTLDSAAYLNEIDKLIELGYVEKKGKWFNSQLKLRLTEKGREVAPGLPDAERKLIGDHGVSFSSLAVLQDVIDYEAREGKSPSISMIQDYDNKEASSYQYTVHFNKITESGFATEKGIFRYRIKPTDKGRQLVEEYKSHL